MYVCFLICQGWWLWHSKGTGVAEVMPSKVGLVTQLFLNPERKRRWERNVEQAEVMWMRTKADDERRRKKYRKRCKLCLKTFSVFLYIHKSSYEYTHLMSWLYLARRSDRQGAPVLIYKENTKDHRELHYLVKLLPTHGIWNGLLTELNLGQLDQVVDPWRSHLLWELKRS